MKALHTVSKDRARTVPSSSSTASAKIWCHSSAGRGLSGFFRGRRGKSSSLPDTRAYGLGCRRMASTVLIEQVQSMLEESNGNNVFRYALRVIDYSRIYILLRAGAENIVHFLQKLVIIVMFLGWAKRNVFAGIRLGHRRSSELVSKCAQKVRSNQGRLYRMLFIG